MLGTLRAQVRGEIFNALDASNVRRLRFAPISHLLARVGAWLRVWPAVTHDSANALSEQPRHSGERQTVLSGCGLGTLCRTHRAPS